MNHLFFAINTPTPHVALEERCTSDRPSRDEVERTNGISPPVMETVSHLFNTVSVAIVDGGRYELHPQIVRLLSDLGPQLGRLQGRKIRLDVNRQTRDHKIDKVKCAGDLCRLGYVAVGATRSEPRNRKVWGNNPFVRLPRDGGEAQFGSTVVHGEGVKSTQSSALK